MPPKDDLNKTLSQVTEEIRKQSKALLQSRTEAAQARGDSAVDIEKSNQKMLERMAKDRKDHAEQARKDDWKQRQKALTEEIAAQKGMSEKEAKFRAASVIQAEKDKDDKRQKREKSFFGRLSNKIRDKASSGKGSEERIEALRQQKGFFKSLKSMFSKKDKDDGGGIASFLGKIFKKIKGVFKLVLGKFLLIGAAVALLISQMNIEQLKAVWESLKTAFTAIVKFLKPIITWLINWVEESVLPNVVQFFIDTFKTISDVFSNVAEIFEGWTEMSFMEKVGAVFVALGEIVKGLGDIAINLVKKVGAMFGLDGKFFADLWENIKMIPGFMGELIDDAIKWFSDKFSFDTSSFTKFSIGDTIMKGVNAAIGWIEDKFDFKFPKFKIPSPKEMLKKFAPDKDSLFWKMPGTDSLFQAVYGKQPDPPVDYSKLEKKQADAKEAGKFETRDAYMRSDEYKQLTGGKGKTPKFLKEAYSAHLAGKPMTPPKIKAGEKSIADMSTSELDQIKKDEGFRKGVYKDTMGIKTIGYGFNLERAGSQEALDAANITSSLEDLKSGKMKLSEEEASRLMMGEMGHFRSVAKRYVGEDTWKNLSSNRQGIITNMAYNMGEGTLGKFEKLRKAIQKGDWKEAQVQMKDSAWAGQVKGRADRLVARMGGDEKSNGLNSIQTANNTAKDSKGQPIIVSPTNVGPTTTIHKEENTMLAGNATNPDNRQGKV